MKWLGLLALFAYTFGALTYGSMLVLWVREMGRLGWGARFRVLNHPRAADAVNGALLFVTFLWFGANVAEVLVEFGESRSVPLQILLVLLAYTFPPIIMHLTWSEVCHTHVVPKAWGRLLPVAYVLCTVQPAAAIAGATLPADAQVRAVAMNVLTAGLSVAFVGAALYSALLVRRFDVVRTPRERDAHRWLLRLFAFMALLFVFMLVVHFTTAFSDTLDAYASRIVEIAAKSLPLVFLFVGTYYENRFRFFDLLVKRGVALLLALGSLTLWFALVMPFLARTFDRQWAAPWLYAVALLPVIGALPWIYARIAADLDRRWLGRRYKTVEAVKLFLSGLRSATTEAQLVDSAQRGLTEIFEAPSLVALGDADSTSMPFEVHQKALIPTPEGAAGAFFLGRRATDAPYFSGDVALLSSLADVFASVLQNLHLQQRRLEQEQRTRELSLHASRSELKALRAQINPHFLFNALNAIAGLIHRDPAVADRTVEQLADVFRYALRGAESEWAILDDELEFVTAYLDVERARFGDRLQASVEMADAARGTRVPTMVVQTLVENAVKHGVSNMRGPGLVAVRAAVDQGRLEVSVTDNGPGFDDTTAPPRARGGYGLANVRQRLAGYFGDDAALRVERDDTRGVTVVSIVLPILRDEPRAPAPHAEASR